MTTQHEYQDFLSRDLIDMALEYRDDKSMLEYASSLCFNLDMVFENTGTTIRWHDVFNVLDKWTFSNIDRQTFANDIEFLKSVRDDCQARIDNES